MTSEEINRPRQPSPRGRQARALTRAIDMLSDEFIENFSQTGVDNGPEKASHSGSPSAELHSKQVVEAREARERREAREEKDSSAAKVEFVGFASLLAKAKKNTGESAFSRLLDDSDASNAATNDGCIDSANQANITSFKPGTETTADGSVIRVRETGKKKRGLYTSCMQKPSAAEVETASIAMQEAASTEQREAEVGILKPSAAQIEAAIVQAAEANAARAKALELKRVQEKGQACCPIMKSAVIQIVGLWRKLTSWTKTKAG